MPYKKYNPREVEKETTNSTLQKAVYKPPAIVGAKPEAPSSKSKPFPSPFAGEIETITMDIKQEDVVMEGEGKSKDALNKVSDGKIKKKGKRYDKKRWLGGKANANANLRRLVYPKTPWTILENLGRSLQLEINVTYLEPFDEEGVKLFPCEVNVNGDIYTGNGPDKDISRNIAAENAIQAYCVHVVKTDSAQPDVEVSDPLDNAPWAALASLGLFKLFNDWESRGFNLPLKNPPNNVGDNQMGGEAKKAKGNANGDFVMKPCKKMPEDPSTKHPVMLINEVYPGIAFECGNRGVDELYSITVTINDQQFTGRGRSKKDAKKECAIAAARALLNVEYSVE